MSDDKLPKIPSFAELGISEDEIEELEREIEKELEEARAKEEGRDPVPVPEGDKVGAGKAKPPREKKKGRGRGLRFGGRKRKKAEGAGAEGAAATAAAGAAGSAPPSGARLGDVGKTPSGPRPGGPLPGAKAQPGGKPDPGGKAEPAPKSAAGPSPESTPPPWNGARGPVTLALLLIVAWFSSSFRTIPSPVAANAPDSVFSSGRAMSHLVRIASEAHPPGSPAHADVREYLLAQLRALGHEPIVQTATSTPSGDSITRAATVRNILARIPGSQPGGRAVLVTAHYDSREIALGAADDGSGVVAILEALRALGTGPPLRNDLIVLITDAEELGLLGAQAFVDHHPWMADVALVVSIEMRGGGGPSMMFETGAENGWVIDALRRANPRPAANSVGFEIYQHMPNDTDFTPLKEAGKQGLNFAGVARANVYHQVYDSPDNLDEGTLQHHGVQVLAMLREFGNADLSAVNGPDQSYLSLPMVGLVTYGKLWIWVLGVAAFLLWVVALVAVRLGGARISGFAAGFVASVLQLGGAGAAGYFLFAWRRGAHPELGALHAGAFHSEGWYVLSIVAVAFVLATLSLWVLRKWFSTGELAVGALFVPVVLAAVATVMFPMAAVNFQWPALAGCVGALAFTKVAPGARSGLLRWIVVVLAAVPVVAVLTPLTEGVWMAKGLGLGWAVAVLVGLVFLQVVPLLDAVREPNGWWAPVAGLVLAGIFLAVGMSTARPSVDRPAPSTLVYLQDRETGSAYWGTDPTRDDSDPGVAWAAAAVGPFDAGRGAAVGDASDTASASGAPGRAREVQTFTRGDEAALRRTMMAQRPAEALRALNTRGVRYALAATQPLNLPPPTVTVVTDSTVAPDMLRVSVTSAIGAEMMLFRPGDGGSRLAALNGKAVAARVGSWRMEHWGEPEGGVLLDFERSSTGAVLHFTIVEHHLRPGELLGNTVFARPAELAPNIRTLSDRAMIRTTVSVDVATGAVTFVMAAEGAGGGEADEAGDAVTEPGAAGEDAVATGDSADVAIEDTTMLTDTTPPRPDTTTLPDTGSVRRR